MFTVELRRSAVRALRRMSRDESARIQARLIDLGYEPRSQRLDVKKLQGRSGFRSRVGDWRILYDIDDPKRIVTVLDIRQRGEAYR